MNQNSTQPNYWIARMTIPGSTSIKETWQWPEAIKRNVYIAQYLYEENGNWAQVTSFYKAAENVKVGDVLLLTYARDIYAYGKVIERPESNQFRTTGKRTESIEQKKGIVVYGDVPTLYEDLDFVNERKQNETYSNIQHGLENWKLSWRQLISVDKWHCFNGSPFANTIGVSKYAKGSYRMTLFEVDSKFCEEKDIVIE